MRTTAIALVTFLFAGAFSEEVLTLTSDNFQKTVDSTPFLLVEFYAPWCGHCKKLAPEYEKAAAETKKLDLPVVLAKVDATEETELATKFGVKGYPTLKWFVNGKVTDYAGGRTASTIVSWVQKKTGPAAKTISTVEDLKTFQDSADAVVVGFFADESEAKPFLDHAGTDDENPYAVCYGDCNALKEHATISKERKLAVLQKFDDGKAEFEGDLKETSEIASFVASNVLPVIVPFSQQTAPKIFNGAINHQLLIFVDSQDSEEANKIFEVARPVSKAFKEKLLFVSIAQSDARVMDFFGVKPEHLPTLRMVQMDPAGVKKYKFIGSEITGASIAKFVEDYFAGNLQVDLKTEEPIPESEQGNVRVVVGKDFEKVVGEPGKDVLLEFYAPWCGHCKKLEPEYNALGEHFKDNENVVIAKIDATANEVERVSISGFPTIKFFPADSDEIVDYDGSRDKAGMIKFLEKNAKTLQ